MCRLYIGPKRVTCVKMLGLQANTTVAGAFLDLHLRMVGCCRFKDPHRSYLSVTHQGGTPNYMAPELFNARSVQAASPTQLDGDIITAKLSSWVCASDANSWPFEHAAVNNALRFSKAATVPIQDGTTQLRWCWCCHCLAVVLMRLLMCTAWAASCTSVWQDSSPLDTWRTRARASMCCSRCEEIIRVVKGSCRTRVSSYMPGLPACGVWSLCAQPRCAV